MEIFICNCRNKGFVIEESIKDTDSMSLKSIEDSIPFRMVDKDNDLTKEEQLKYFVGIDDNSGYVKYYGKPIESKIEKANFDDDNVIITKFDLYTMVVEENELREYFKIYNKPNDIDEIILDLEDITKLVNHSTVSLSENMKLNIEYRRIK